MHLLYFQIVFLGLYCTYKQVAAASTTSPSVVIVGSVNADIIVPLERAPALGETIVAKDTPDTIAGQTVAGGKGANQAVSCSRLGATCSFIGRFGSDANAAMLRRTLEANGVDVSLCTPSERPSGMGLVFLLPKGEVSCVVVGGSNADWPEDIDLEGLFEGNVRCVMLQMEVPQRINELVAAAAHARGVPVFQDVGGEERPISSEHLRHCTYVSPNLTELRRLTQQPVDTEEEIVAAAKSLQSRGARNVLVTLGDAGSLLVSAAGLVTRQRCIPVPTVVDETGAGDNYRGAFVVAHFIDGKDLQASMEFAAAAGKSRCAGYTLCL